MFLWNLQRFTNNDVRPYCKGQINQYFEFKQSVPEKFWQTNLNSILEEFFLFD